jgi:hypothetical protein
MLVILGVALAALAAFLVARPMLLDSRGSSSEGTSATPTTAAPLTPAKPAKATPTPAQPEVVLLPGLPAKVANRLQHSRVVVVAIYTGTDPGDRAAVGAARRGAKEAGVGFTALNVLDEKTARQVQPFLGTTSTPVELVVVRPGKVVSKFAGHVDKTIVAQAATNAVARGKRT